MEILGSINSRQILYCNIRSDRGWHEQLPIGNWLAFTIVDNADKELLDEIVINSLDKGTCYICSVGELASETDDYFDGEVVLREVLKEEKTGEPQDYDKAPMTVFFSNFDEGFWFALITAYATIADNYIDINSVICIDATKNRVRRHILNLIEKINDGWLPSEGAIELPIYDDGIGY